MEWKRYGPGEWPEPGTYNFKRKIDQKFFKIALVSSTGAAVNIQLSNDPTAPVAYTYIPRTSEALIPGYLMQL